MKEKEIEAKGVPQKWYALPDTIYKELKENISNIKIILKDDQKSCDYMLKEILSLYTKGWVSSEIGEWIHDNYDKTLSIKDYNKLLNSETKLVKYSEFNG